MRRWNSHAVSQRTSEPKGRCGIPPREVRRERRDCGQKPDVALRYGRADEAAAVGECRRSAPLKMSCGNTAKSTMKLPSAWPGVAAILHRASALGLSRQALPSSPPCYLPMCANDLALAFARQAPRRRYVRRAEIDVTSIPLSFVDSCALGKIIDLALVLRVDRIAIRVPCHMRTTGII
jgi:hypothetical protein